ncbi:MAG: cytochrome c family protein [Phenylobacterium sp.]|uniref:c-type cytochrome n=1 Tax=Phenylobacterium sp. TaxID=1871053 RepID=UPI001A432DC9|nr:cytochrome c family protein [Phenylobacterium sp.]MBL8556883.1 cytochrome c family protein [Phenylobacterium sp.]
MSDLTFNKIFGAVLATGLAIVGLRELSAGVFAPEHPAKPGYVVEVAEGGGGEAAAADTPPDWGTVLPAANVAAGEASFAKCKSCHSIQEGGPNGTGPDLWGVVGRKPGTHGGFAYSTGMTDFGGKQPQWDYDHLYEFIKGPQKYIAGTKMTFVGIKKPEDRINLIAYLKAQGGTLAVPAPDPSRAPGAAAAAAPAAEGAAAPAAAEGAPTTTAAAPATQGAAGQGPVAPAAAASPVAPAKK